MTEESQTPARQPASKEILSKSVTPRWIYRKLDEYVVGQERFEEGPERGGVQPLQAHHVQPHALPRC